MNSEVCLESTDDALSGQLPDRPAVAINLPFALMCLHDSIEIRHQEVHVLFGDGFKLHGLHISIQQSKKLLGSPAALIAIAQLVRPSAGMHDDVLGCRL